MKSFKTQLSFGGQIFLALILLIKGKKPNIFIMLMKCFRASEDIWSSIAEEAVILPGKRPLVPLYYNSFIPCVVQGLSIKSWKKVSVKKKLGYTSRINSACWTIV